MSRWLAEDDTENRDENRETKEGVAKPITYQRTQQKGDAVDAEGHITGRVAWG